MAGARKGSSWGWRSAAPTPEIGPRVGAPGRVSTVSRPRRLAQVTPIALVVAAVVAFPVVALSPAGLPRLERLREDRARAERELAALQEEIAVLRAEVRALNTEPAAVERVARDSLLLVRPNELVFVFDRP